MTRLHQLIAPVVFGAVVATTAAIVAPQLFAVQATPVVAEIPAAVSSESKTLDVTLASDGSVDMNHWQETGAPITPYTTGTSRKGGK